MKRLIVFFITAVFAVVLPKVASARLGVGVGTGKIVVDQTMFPGTIYQLPDLTVVNTGDEPSEYEVGVEYHEQQAEKMPARDWFIFSPAKFYLEPNKVQVVNMKLNLPVRAEPGKYFAYLEGRPLAKAESGVTRVGIAAATKLYFEIQPANAVLGVYHKVLSAWKVYAPWPARITVTLLVVILMFVFKKFFHLNIEIRAKPSAKKQKKK